MSIGLKKAGCLMVLIKPVISIPLFYTQKIPPVIPDQRPPSVIPDVFNRESKDFSRAGYHE